MYRQHALHCSHPHTALTVPVSFLLYVSAAPFNGLVADLVPVAQRGMARYTLHVAADVWSQARRYCLRLHAGHWCVADSGVIGACVAMGNLSGALLGLSYSAVGQAGLQIMVFVLFLSSTFITGTGLCHQAVAADTGSPPLTTPCQSGFSLVLQGEAIPSCACRSFQHSSTIALCEVQAAGVPVHQGDKRGPPAAHIVLLRAF